MYILLKLREYCASMSMYIVCIYLYGCVCVSNVCYVSLNIRTYMWYSGLCLCVCVLVVCDILIFHITI